MRQNKITFEDAGAEQDAEQNETYSIPYPTNAWYAMATDETLPLAERDEAAKQLEALADGGDRYAQYLTGILCRDGGLLKKHSTIWDWLRSRIMQQRSMHWVSCSSQMIRK